MHTQVSLQLIEEMFANIAKDSGWDMNSNMLWSYFFFDKDKSKLEVAASKLEQEGYQIPEIISTDDGKTYRLVATKVGIHNPNSLLNLHEELINFANENEIEQYDGFDVGP